MNIRTKYWQYNRLRNLENQQELAFSESRQGPQQAALLGGLPRGMSSGVTGEMWADKITGIKITRFKADREESCRIRKEAWAARSCSNGRAAGWWPGWRPAQWTHQQSSKHDDKIQRPQHLKCKMSKMQSKVTWLRKTQESVTRSQAEDVWQAWGPQCQDCWTGLQSGCPS